MKPAETDSQQNGETLRHLLAVVDESREKRCAEVCENARRKANDRVKQAHIRSRGRLHRHVNTLREKHRVQVSETRARNKTLFRQKNQKADRAALDAAWPVLREAMLALWQQSVARGRWLDAAVASARSRLLDRQWCIEHPPALSEPELNNLKQRLVGEIGVSVELTAKDDLEAGIRISTGGTVVDATLDGLLYHRTAIEALLIARIKQGA